MTYDMNVFVDCFLSQNLGDDLFLFTLVSRYPHVRFRVYADERYRYLDERFPNLERVAPRPGPSDRGLIGRISDAHASVRRRVDIISASDAMVTIGGSIYMESRKRGVGEMIQRRYRSYKDVSYARAAGRYFILGANFGPYRTEGYRSSYGRFFAAHCDDVCFRETYSAELFPGVPVVRSAPDVLFTASLPQVARRRQVLFSVVDLGNVDKFGDLSSHRDDYESWLLRSAEECAGAGYDVVFASFSSPEGDDAAVRRLSGRASERGVAVRELMYADNMDELLGELAASEIVVGTRFHATILGLVAGARVLPVMYSSKTRHVLEDMGFDMDAAIDLKTATADAYASRDVLRDAIPFDVREVAVRAQGQFAKLDSFLGA